MSRTIFLSNSANQEFQGIILPSGDWHMADVCSAQAWQYFMTIGSLKTVNDFIRLYKGASQGLWSPEFIKAITQFFDKYSLRVNAGESKALYSQNMTYPHEYLNSAQWGSMCRNPNWSLFLRSKDGNWTSFFSSNDDWSWITQGKGNGYESVRSKPGKVWQSDHEAGQHNFDQVRMSSNAQESASV